jgi:pilus assembly protein CpaC
LRAAWPLAVGLVVMAASGAAQAQTLELVTGQQRVLSLPGVTRIAIANPNVADVKVVEGGDVLVTAVGAGQTELTVWQGQKISKFVVSVAGMDPQQLKREVERMLGDRDGIRVKLGRDNAVIIEGVAQTYADFEKAEEIEKRFPQVRNQVRLDPSSHANITDALNKQLSRAGLNGARAHVVGSTIFLEGVVDTEADLKKADLLTRSLGAEVQSMLRVGAARMVELDVEFVEVSKNSLDRIGIRWPTDINAELSLEYTSTKVLQGAAADMSSFTAQARAAASFGLTLQFNDGVTRTLARPRLVTASGREAKFLAGGEVPIPIVTQDRIYVDYKEYGVRLQITPVVDGSGTIQTKILTEISDVDDSVAVMGIPGFISRRVDTEVTVRDGETIVLSGLLHLAEGKDITKVPILGHIPIIGELFKSRRFRDRQTELVVFVTPRIVDPLSKHLRELSADMLRKYDEAESDMKFSIFD